MWNEAYKLGQLSLDMELSTYCNAKCPACSRTNEHNNLNKQKWMPLDQVSISKFKKWFSPKDVSSIGSFHFAGTYGDPGMCKDLYEIVSYIIDNSTTTKISINTNGSMRDEDFWWDIGAKGQKRVKITFDVDGINQEMHEFYRRGTKLSKILDNMSAAAQTPADIRVLTVIFKHNQDYLEQIQDMCRERGAKKFDSVEGNNFRKGPTYKFKDEDGNERQLIQITRKDREQGLKRLNRKVRDHRHASSIKKYIKIECSAAKSKNLKVNVTGMVGPCCYLATPLVTSSIYKPHAPPSRHITTSGRGGFHPLMKEYVDNHHLYTLGNRTIGDIINDPWWNDLKNSWSDIKTASYGCERVCGKCD